jgi:hypothetical protein
MVASIQLGTVAMIVAATRADRAFQTTSQVSVDIFPKQKVLIVLGYFASSTEFECGQPLFY